MLTKSQVLEDEVGAGSEENVESRQEKGEHAGSCSAGRLLASPKRIGWFSQTVDSKGGRISGEPQLREACDVAYAAALDAVLERIDDPARKGPLLRLAIGSLSRSD